MQKIEIKSDLKIQLQQQFSNIQIKQKLMRTNNCTDKFENKF